MIVATAGHVDHGKTSLVRALTGVDTDRLEAEKQRGLTIEVGFAYADFGGDTLTGFVDVPGHERFVRNMLAGINAIDLALLVVAADDGPMPQTREHLAILALLGARQMAVVLTKVDRATADQRQAAIDAIHALLADTPFAKAPCFEVDTPRLVGIDALRRYLCEQQSRHHTPSAEGAFRLAIDRAFPVSGAGLVVTGAVIAGSLAIGDTLVVSPMGTRVRVRGIHAHQRAAQTARAGQRCALNIVGADLDREKVLRGQWLVAESAHAPTDLLDASLDLLPDVPRALPHLASVQVHMGAAIVNARAAILGEKSLPAGAKGRVRLLLEQPVAALWGDRFVLRDPAAQKTLGGGLIIDPFGPVRGRATAGRLAALDALALPEPEQALSQLLRDNPLGLAIAPFERARNLSAEQRQTLHQRVQMRLMPAPDGAIALAPEMAQSWQQAVLHTLSEAHAREPSQVGPIESVLARATVSRQVPVLEPGRLPHALALASAAIRAQIDTEVVVRQGVCLRLASHRALLSASDQARLDQVMIRLRQAGMRPPIVGELATELGLERTELLAFLRSMARLGHLMPVAPNRFFPPESLAAFAQVARQLAADSADGSFDAAAYRDASGIGRNLTIEVLEFLDRMGITQFAGNRRRMKP